MSIFQEIDPPTRRPKESPEARAERLVAQENHRLAQREAIKQRKLEAINHCARLAQIDTLSAGCESRKESYAAAHIEACRPLQEQLRALEAEGLDGEAQYRELRDAIDELNGRLKANIDREDKRLEELATERRTVAALCNTSLLNSDLIRLGNPMLLERMNATAALAKALESYVGRAREQGNKSAVEIAQRFVSMARSEADAALLAVIDE